MHTHIAIIEPHHALDDGSIRRLGMPCIDGTHMLGTHHEEIKVDRRTATG